MQCLIHNLVDPWVLMNALLGNDKALACKQTVSSTYSHYLCPVDNDLGHISLVTLLCGCHGVYKMSAAFFQILTA